MVRRLEKIREVFEPIEIHFIDDLLPKVFYHGPADLQRPDAVRHSTLFIYDGGRSVKFQRIRGNGIPGGNPAHVYCPGTGSTDAGAIRSMYFVREGNSILKVAGIKHGEWREAQLGELDVLLVSVYENDSLPRGDYIYLDISKYVEAARGGLAVVDFALVSDRDIGQFALWQVVPSLVTSERPVPLVFRRLVDTRTDPDLMNAARVQKRITTVFDGWPELLDWIDAVPNERFEDGTSREDAESFLSVVRSTLKLTPGDPLVEVFSKKPSVSGVASTLLGPSTMILSAFAWS